MHVKRQQLVSRLAVAAKHVTIARQLLLDNETQRVLSPLERERLTDLVMEAETNMLSATAIANEECL